MLNTIQDAAISAWTSGRKTRKDSKGWISGNAVCCQHNGETADKRGRGGMIGNPDGTTSYACFNCAYKAHYVPGYPLNYKFRRLLKWLNLSDSEVQRLYLESLREQQRQEALGLVKIAPKKEEVKANFKKEPLPEGATSLLGMAEFYLLKTPLDDIPKYPKEFLAIVDYLSARKVDLGNYEYYWTENTDFKWNKRVIVPFTWKNEIIGYSARAITDDLKPKYIQKIDTGYVFNIDKQGRDWKVVIVCEGVFDAISIDAVAVLKADVTKQQVDIIESLDREIIVVPDWNKTGGNLIDVALANGWAVSFPVWAETCVDINQAVQKYGKLFTLKAIIDGIERSELKIKLMRKKYESS